MLALAETRNQFPGVAGEREVVPVYLPGTEALGRRKEMVVHEVYCIRERSNVGQLVEAPGFPLSGIPFSTTCPGNKKRWTVIPVVPYL